jgi:hypothetical protein
MMRGKTRAILVASIVLLAGAAVYFGMGGVVHRVLARAIFNFIIVPAAALEVIVICYLRWKKGAFSHVVLSWMVTTTLLGVVVWGTVPLGRGVQAWEKSRARSFPQSLDSTLEEYRKSQGVYPSDLSMIIPKPSTPRLLSKGWGGYCVSFDGSYWFSYKDPDGPLNWRYDSDHKQWVSSGD